MRFVVKSVKQFLHDHLYTGRNGMLLSIADKKLFVK